MTECSRTATSTEHSKIVVRGDIVGGGVDRLRDAVAEALASGVDRLLVDVSEVGCMEPSAYRFLTEAAGQMTARGGWLKLLNAGPICSRMIDTAALDLADDRVLVDDANAPWGDTSTTAQGDDAWIEIGREELVTA